MSFACLNSVGVTFTLKFHLYCQKIHLFSESGFTVASSPLQHRKRAPVHLNPRQPPLGPSESSAHGSEQGFPQLSRLRWEPDRIQSLKICWFLPSFCAFSCVFSTSVSLLRFHRSRCPTPSTQANRAGCVGDHMTSYT